MKQPKYDIFISYSSKDKDIAFKILEAIESTGHTCWIAPRNIPYGTPYARAIMEGIDECDKFMVLITDNSIKSEDVLNEIDNAHAIKKVIIPVRLTDTPLPRELNYYLSRTQWLTLNPNNPHAIVTLLALSDTKPQAQDIKIPIDKQSTTKGTKHSSTPIPKVKSKTISKLLGILLNILSLFWLIYSFSNRHVSDNLVAVSFLGSTGLFILMIMGLVKPSLLGLASRTESFLFMGLPGIFLFTTIGAYVETDVQSDTHADTIIDSSNLQNVANDSIIISEQSSAIQMLGEEAFNRGDYSEAVRYFKEMSDYDDSYGIFMLGKCYYSGLGVTKDLKIAFELFSQAAETNMPAAVNSKGVCYLKGRGTKQDYDKAAECFRVAAEDGLPVAQANLADCYVYGNGVGQNYQTAKEWYEKAANQEYAPAAFNIGRLYYNGRPGVGLNYGKAAHWYKIAANLGLAEAQNSIGVCYLKGQGVERDQDEAFIWFERAAMQGNASGLYNLANCYRDGNGVKKDKIKAKQLYKEAIDKGSTSAAIALKKL